MVVDQNESKSQLHRQQILHPYLGKHKIQAIELFFIVNKILFSERIWYSDNDIFLLLIYLIA